MKIEAVRRFNSEKKGSYEVQVWMTDWECSVTIGGLKKYKKANHLPKGTKTFVERHLIGGFSKALGAVLKAEFGDLKKHNLLKTRPAAFAEKNLSFPE